MKDVKNEDRDLFTAQDVEFQDKDKQPIWRPVVWCHNVEELKRRLAERRGKVVTKLATKFGVDGGKKNLKGTMTLYDLEDFEKEEDMLRKRASKISDCKDFKDTYVRKVQVMLKLFFVFFCSAFVLYFLIKLFCCSS